MRRHKEKDVLVVELTERDLKDPIRLNAAFEEMIVEEEERKILVDLSPVKAMTSLMIGAVVSIHTVAYENVAMLKFTGLSEKVRMLFRLLGIDKLIEMHYGSSDTFGEMGRRRSDA